MMIGPPISIAPGLPVYDSSSGGRLPQKVIEKLRDYDNFGITTKLKTLRHLGLAFSAEI